MAWKCPRLQKTIVVADDAQLAATLSCVYAQKNTYLPIVDGPRLTRPDAGAEAIRRNNAIVRCKSETIILAGLTDASFLAMSMHLPSSRMRRVQSLSDVDSLSSPHQPANTPLFWGADRIGVGVLKAMRANRPIAFSNHPSSTENLVGNARHLVVCEEGEDLSQVIAANYAFALGADFCLIPDVPKEVSEKIMNRFYGSDQSKEFSQSSILGDLRSEIRSLCAGISVPEYGSMTFFTGEIPYGFAFPEVPSTHLFKYPDLGISVINGFAAEQDGTPGITVAALVNPGTVEAPELSLAVRSFESRRVFIREYRGAMATVQHIYDMVEFFPYDLLMIATHCGDASGYRWTYEFVDSEGIERTLVVDIAIGVARTNEEDMLNVMQFTNFVSLDGVDWNDPNREEKLYVGTAILDWAKRTGEGADLEPTLKQTVDRVTWSSALRMFDGNYIAIPRAMANGRTPIVINNACGSWHRLAENFTFSNARMYIGTLFPISTSEVEQVIKRLIEVEFQKPLPVAVWAAQRKVYKGTFRRPYVVTGVFTQWLRTSDRDVPEEVFQRLRVAHREWVGILSRIDSTTKRYRATKDIVDYHARELSHFAELTGRRH